MSQCKCDDLEDIDQFEHVELDQSDCLVHIVATHKRCFHCEREYLEEDHGSGLVTLTDIVTGA